MASGHLRHTSHQAFSAGEPHHKPGPAYRWVGTALEFSLFGYRDYLPDIGRWTAKDPLFLAGGDLDLYAYCGQDPINRIDPDGTFWWFLAGALFSGVGGTIGTINAIDTLMNPCSTGAEKVRDVALAAASIYVPGGGAGRAARAFGGGGGGKGFVDLFRAVSPAEFDDIMAIGGFRAAPSGMSLAGKQFGHNLDEVVRLADFFPEAAAVVRTRVPRAVFETLDHTAVDAAILRSGSTTVQPEMLEAFNRSIIEIIHAF